MSLSRDRVRRAKSDSSYSRLTKIEAKQLWSAHLQNRTKRTNHALEQQGTYHLEHIGYEKLNCGSCHRCKQTHVEATPLRDTRMRMAGNCLIWSLSLPQGSQRHSNCGGKSDKCRLNVATATVPSRAKQYHRTK